MMLSWYKNWERGEQRATIAMSKQNITKTKEKENDLLQMIFGRKIPECLWNDSSSPQENPNHSGDVKQ